MSLEQVLQANTDAVIALTKALWAQQAEQPTEVSAEKTKATPATKKSEPAKEVKVAVAETTPESVPAPAPAPESAPVDFVPEVNEAAKALTSEEVEARRSDVRVVVLTLAKKNRAEATALLLRHGVEGISKILPEHFDSVMKLGRQILEGKASALYSSDETGME
jgi:hypothetical protein